MAWLALDRIGKSFGDRWLFRDVTLELAPHQRITLTGKSGSGKSTLLRILAGLEDPTTGVRHLDSSELHFRSRAFYLHQTPAFGEGSLRHSLELPFQWKQHRHKKAPRWEALLERIGWEPQRLETASDRLSGGERQVAALLRAIGLDPEFLFLDEPLTGLDADTRARVEAWLLEQKLGFVWITHESPVPHSQVWKLEREGIHGL